MQKAAVIGLGTMGPGMVARLARGGLSVAVHDTSADAMARAPDAIALANGVLDRLGIAAPADGPGAITFHATLADTVAGADLVIENVPEKLEIKAAVYQALGALVTPETIVASDTSGLPITALQAHFAYPAQLVGMHWSNPPHIIPMIEVISGAKTDPSVAQAVVALIRRLGLLPVVVARDVPGFVENRILYAVLREAIDLVEQGVVSPEDLDTCVSWGIGYKLAVIGPMALLDMAGLDIYTSVASYLNADLSDRKTVADFVTEKTAAGKLGIKSGEGLYTYTPEEAKALQARRAATLVAVRRILEGRG